MANFPSPPAGHTSSQCPSYRTALLGQVATLLTRPRTNPPTLPQCIRLYIRYQRPNSQAYLNSFVRMTLPTAIAQAALSTCPVCNCLHPHQCHIGYNKCQQWSTYLVNLANLQANLANVNTFEDIFQIIQKAYAKWPLSKLNGNNQLLVYDTALRISAQLGLLPNALVYLHAAAHVPSVPKHYRGKHSGTLPVTKFLPAFARNQMTAYEIEEFLCNFHTVLKKYYIPVIR